MNEMQNTPSMLEKFPDAISCGIGSYKHTMLFLVGASDYVYYRQIWYGYNIQVKFSLDGIYYSGEGGDFSGCIDQSIQQLYANGRAFSFVNDFKQVQQLQNLEEENNLLNSTIEFLIIKSLTIFQDTYISTSHMFYRWI